MALVCFFLIVSLGQGHRKTRLQILFVVIVANFAHSFKSRDKTDQRMYLLLIMTYFKTKNRNQLDDALINNMCNK